MAKDLKPHIGIFGRRNNGKSSLINFITGQAIAIVSECAGTTTDPVKKSIEIFGLGPCVLIDTAGIDDVGILGEQRIEKTWQIMDEIDCAIIVITDNQFGTPEKDLAERLQKRAVPFFVVHNKSDLNPLNENLKSMVEKGLNTTVLEFSTLASWRETALPTLVEMLKKTLPESAFQKQSLLGGLVKANETVVMVCPVDSEAPEGRLILPQVMAIRDALDNDAICTVIKETQLEHYLLTMPQPNLIVTDSQVFDYVSHLVPADIPLTSFSILMARMRGDFEQYIKGTPTLSKLNDGDKILLLESCTHHSTCEDIGRVKLPRMIQKFSGKALQFEFVSGLTPIADIRQYALVIQCGGCMMTRKQLVNRTNLAVNAGIPISNYGMAIAYMTGIFERVLEPFV